MSFRANSVDDLPERIREQVREKLGCESQEKKSKYNNKRCQVDDCDFDSLKEAERYSQLRLLCKAGEVCALCLQVPFRLPGKVTYVADFVYYDLKRMGFVVEDAKGFRTKEYQIKKKLMREIGIEVEEV